MPSLLYGSSSCSLLSKSLFFHYRLVHILYRLLFSIFERLTWRHFLILFLYFNCLHNLQHSFILPNFKDISCQFIYTVLNSCNSTWKLVGFRLEHTQFLRSTLLIFYDEKRKTLPPKLNIF